MAWGAGLAVATLFLVMLPLAAQAEPVFKAAKPVWPAGREMEKNLTVGFRTTFDFHAGQHATLRAAGSTTYRIKLNGQFLGYGPARGPHGWYRVDEIDLSRRAVAGANVLTFEVCGYNVNSYALLDQPSFLQAEVEVGGKVVASTGKEFVAGVLHGRVQKTQRYSFQRPFSEAYVLSPETDSWLVSGRLSDPLKVAVQQEKKLLPRRVPLSEFEARSEDPSFFGRLKHIGLPAAPWKDRSLTGIGIALGGYLESELSTVPSLNMQTLETSEVFPWSGRVTGESLDPIHDVRLLKKDEFFIHDFSTNLTGFVGIELTCKKRSKVVLTFDEILTNGDVDFKRLGCVNAIEYDLAPGTYHLESIEPYTMRYLKVNVLDGEAHVGQATLREYVSPTDGSVSFHAGDVRLDRLFQAGVETYRQNAVDVFMDCPSRERAGWLCDSFFTARVEHDLTGDTLIEKNMFENFSLPESFKFLPEGMLPMCYPSDHNDGVFIPNWAMWFVVQLEEYTQRSGDTATVQKLRPRLEKLIKYFEKFKNSDGLLEKLESWVFVEWSDANNFVQDVNYPTNMLYAEVLAAMGRMYGRQDLADQAAHIREVIRKQSFDGNFFVDNAVRKDGKLTVTKNRSEVCQYFAFFFHVATPESHPDLWKTLVKDFGPKRKETNRFSEVRPANAFVGNVLRLELLSRAGLCRQLLDESLAYQLYMVDRTGTLWENDGAYASCNHGFASHGGVRLLYRDILGLYDVDTVRKAVTLRFTDLEMSQCEGSRPVPGGEVSLKWMRDDKAVHYWLSVPDGYKVRIDNLGRLPLVKH